VVITLEGSKKKTSTQVVHGFFSPRCQFSCKPSATAVETSTPVVDFGDSFGVGGVEGSQLRMWSSHWKGPKRRPQNDVAHRFFLLVASFHASPVPQRWRQAPLMLALGTSLVLVEWKEANSGCGHHIGRVRKEDLKTMSHTDFSSSLPVFMQAQCHGGGHKRP